MTEQPPTNAVPIRAEEHSRPVFRLLARAAILLARLSSPPATTTPAADSATDEEADDA